MTPEKCAHPACECVVEKGGRFGKYCSEHCKEAGPMMVLRCHCHHPQCTEAAARSTANPPPARAQA